jgi:hypothetical protein
MSTRAFFQGLLAQERGLFVKVVQAVLDDGLEHRPDPKARCSRELIEHLIGHNLDLAELLDDGVIHHRRRPANSSRNRELLLRGYAVCRWGRSPTGR